MPSSSRTGELIYEPEVEKAARRRRQETKRRKEGHLSSANESVEDEFSMANTQTLRELATPKLTHQPLCITFPTLSENTSFELKSGLIQLLPSFYGLFGEEPHKHVKEFEVVCSSMKPPGVTEEQIRLRAFSFSLKDAAKDWLYYLPAGSITTWAQLKKKFLEKFFPASRVASLRKEICSIKQYSGESLSIIDVASGGALANKTAKEAWDLIEAMAENSQQFVFRESNPTRRVNEVETSSIQQQLSELTSAFRQLTMRDTPRARVCGICTSMDHCTDTCPLLQEDGAEQVNMAGGVPAPRRQYDPYSNTYNPDWRDHPNFSYGNRPQNSLSNRPPGFQQPWQPKPQPSSSNAGSSLEDIVKSLATTTAQIQQETRQLQQETRSLTTNMAQLQQETRVLTMSTTQFQQDTRAGMKDMDARISQLATAINPLESHAHGKLPSQPEKNPRNVSAMTLRSGKELEGPKVENSKSKSEEEKEKEIEEEGHIREDPKVPKYAKFLKDLCVNKRKLRGDERVMVGENVSAVLQRKLPPKCGDPGPLKETEIIIQLADRTCAYPDGIIEDVLVQVDGLIFPADFYVLYMDDRSAPNPSPIILGRPFLSTAQTKIDISKGTLTMKFDGEIVHFNIFDTKKHPVNFQSVYAIYATNPSVQEFSKFAGRGKFKVAANKSYRMKAVYEVKMERKFRKKGALNGHVDPGGRPPITRKIQLHPD
ncbi:uncharacterized protein [Coffea arabica]|uniref:Retrotransposon gag domain-containing protein n=1 Tax=Coffea arabica TaxID=13443 RepID=A0A6P6WYA1_COFAR|nr:uncharacterized protein LOC113737372 [Coffea arabica]